MLSEEEWRDVPGWESRYQVSSHGRVRSKDVKLPGRFGGSYTRAGKVVRPVNYRGYGRVTLPDRKLYFVHRLVALAFLGPPPEGKENVLHWDDNPQNNSVENLRWGTLRENSKDAVRNGRHGQANKTHCVRGHELNGDNAREDASGRRRCVVCQKINNKRYLEDAREEGIAPEDGRHGTLTGYYTYACRCKECKNARSEQYQRGKRKRDGI